MSSQAQEDRDQAAEQPSGSVIGLLLEQHARIRELFAAVKTASDASKQARFDELRGLLAVHETGEEMILRPASRKDAGEQVAEARNQEEKEATKVLSELEKLDIASAEFDQKFAALERSVSDHAEHEEREEFPAVSRAHSDEELREMGERLLTAEKMAPTHAHPTAAGSPTAQWTVGPFASLLDRARDAFKS